MGIFKSKFYRGISYTNFQNPLYRDFPVKFFPAVFGPLGLGWPPGGPSGCSACARGDARYRETPRTAARRRLPKSGFLDDIVLYVYAAVYVCTRLPTALRLQQQQRAQCARRHSSYSLLTVRQVRAHYISHDG